MKLVSNVFGRAMGVYAYGSSFIGDIKAVKKAQVALITAVYKRVGLEELVECGAVEKMVYTAPLGKVRAIALEAIKTGDLEKYGEDYFRIVLDFVEEVLGSIEVADVKEAV